MLDPSAFITASPLENFSIRYSNDLSGFVAQKLFTPHIVPKKTGQFYSYSKDNLRVKALEAPSGTEAPVHEWSATKRTFTCVEHRVKGLVLERDARDFDKAMADLDQETAMQNMDALMIEMEADAVTLATTSGNYPSALVTTLTNSTDRWSDAGGDPLENVRASSQAVFEKCGKYPNKLFLSRQGLEVLKLAPGIVDRVKYTSPTVAMELIAALFGLDEIVVASAIKNTANEGAADSLSSIWPDSAVLAYVNPTPALKSMTFGKLFMAQSMFVKSIDRPELGGGLGAHHLESGWEYELKSAASTSSSDADFVAGALIANIY
jgi:hypothetical protein